MDSNFKDFFKAFSTNHDQPEQKAIPDSLEESVKEPSNAGDVSDIFTATYKPLPAASRSTQSVIQSDMIVHGNIEAKNDIDIAGTVDGSISCEGRVYVSGVVSGSVSGNSVNVRAKLLNADINAADRVIINQDTTINGNITASVANIEGTVNGNITANKEIIITASAIITGDLKTAAIEVNRGAVINGNVSFTQKDNQ